MSEEKNTDSINWQERYYNLINSLNIGYSMEDLNETILEVNDTLLKMTGARRDQIIGHKSREFYETEEYERIRDVMRRNIDKGAYQFESYLPTARGDKIPVLYSSFVNNDSKGNPISINVMATDISELKKIQKELEMANQALIETINSLEKEKRKLETILFGIGDCVTIFDLDGNLIMSNPQGMQIYSNEQHHISLKSGEQRELAITIDDEERHFRGQIEIIRDNTGKPFAYVEVLRDVTDQLRLEEQERELFYLRREMKRENLNRAMIGNSISIQRVFDLILRCAEVDSTVLILGETGVGKELAARAIHEQSSRREKPFVAVNCGSLPETLLESELFGHAKGAFTGAISERKGLFREAQGGTLFLDEVGDISEPLQVKLLRALQEKEIRPVGGSQTYQVDVRIIAATNRDLRDFVEQNRFRKDLYYRIAVIPLLIPPLRERREDILPLAKHFIHKHQKKEIDTPIVLDQTAQQLLLDYSWPGNIRELENAIEHALAMSPGSAIGPKELPGTIIFTHDIGKEQKVNDITKSSDTEKEIILDVLKRNNGNRTLAARELGMSRTTLWRKITMYNLL